ncbi:uncharacterized protein [Gossypium hirsutum]|uniref:Reverse transcriptase Ty1/copia-type domain-containing protein n=1 Tax=Gossypium hirsutum TaxID=3635 RepID=A0A1U8KGS8_GOSHI|nr:uncharacterized protein LOC107915519 [Gossypium hirsutum]
MYNNLEKSRKRLHLSYVYAYGASVQFGIVPPPHHFQELDKCSSECTKTGVLGGCLFICHYPDFMQFDIWVMKEYGVKESWTKQFVIKHVYSGSYQPILVLSNGEIFMLSNYPKRTCYNQKGRYLRGAKSFWIPSKFDAISYTPCFVSLYNVAKGEQISRIDAYMSSLEFEKSISEPTLYVKKSENETLLIVSLYVDDLLVTGSKRKLIEEFKRQIQDVLEMTNLREITYFLGIEVK